MTSRALFIAVALCAIPFSACFSSTSSNPDGGGAGSDGGTTGDDTGTGGDTGGGGDGNPAGPCGGSSTELIDDLESGTGSIVASHGRVGAWYTYDDGTSGGTITPAAGATFTPADADSGQPRGKAARMQGNGFTTWGAGMGFDFDNAGGDAGVKKPYDASAYKGVAFWARVGTGTTSVRFHLQTSATVPTSEGGTCSTTKCSDDFGAPLTLTSDWKCVVLKYSDLTQEGWGDPATFDPKTVISGHWQTGKNASFDVWVDDVYFTQ